MLPERESPSLLSFCEENRWGLDESRSSTPRGVGDSPALDAPLTVRGVHALVASPAYYEPAGVSYDTFQRVCGRGFAPWEIHRPQQALRELLTSGVFKGAVLDCGCGIGDNSLFIAKYTNCQVDAVDMLPKCIAFAEMKAGLRNMRNRVGWQCFDLLQWETSPLHGRMYDTAVDSGLLHCLGPESRLRYLSVLHDAVKPGGTLYVLGVSDQEPSPGGPGRLSRADFEELLSAQTGWSLLYVRPATWELHPTFWGGKARAYLAAAQRS